MQAKFTKYASIIIKINFIKVIHKFNRNAKKSVNARLTTTLPDT